jgi:hypothetical protein
MDDRQKAILALARNVGKAADAADWRALAAADRGMAQELPLLAKQGPWKENERKALLILRDIHEKATQRCTEAKDGLEIHLRQIRNNKEGWLAYAFNGGINSDGKQL